VTTGDLTGTIATVRPPLARKRRRPADIAFHVGVAGAVVLTLSVLAWLLVSIVIAGAPALDWGFLTDKTSTSASRAGFASAIRGSVALMAITAVVAIPVGFAAAVHLEKFAGVAAVRAPRVRHRLKAIRVGAVKGRPGETTLLRARLAWARVEPRLTTLLDVSINNLAAVPSIIYGLLGLAVFVSIMGVGKSLLAGGLTLAVLVLPIIIIAAREAIRAVPVSIEQGAMALGATRWQAVSRQVVPAAFPGMLTGTILAMSRAIGESAPLVVVGGLAFGTKLPSLIPSEWADAPLFAMPLQIFEWAGDPRDEFQQLAAGGIVVLLGMLVLMNALAIWLRNRFTRSW
jgi:phosphate transport system permease protein